MCFYIFVIFFETKNFMSFYDIKNSKIGHLYKIKNSQFNPKKWNKKQPKTSVNTKYHLRLRSNKQIYQ